MGSLEDRISRVVGEHVEVVPYDPQWAESFRLEKEHLLGCLPPDLVRRIEHFGSTAVPGLWAKPIVDMLVEVVDLGDTRSRIAPVLEAQGYDYFWRPTRGDDGPPFYAWFIKRDAAGRRTHHIHMVEAEFREHWDRLLFRDYLIARPDVARRYQELKVELAVKHGDDRLAYGRGKAAFIDAVTAEARSGGEAAMKGRLGMVSRHWKGVAKPGQAEAYLHHLRTDTFPKLAQIPGFVRASILKRAVEAGTEFQIVTVWDSLEAIQAFAGSSADSAVVPPSVQGLMVSYETKVAHYEIADTFEPSEARAAEQ